MELNELSTKLKDAIGKRLLDIISNPTATPHDKENARHHLVSIGKKILAKKMQSKAGHVPKDKAFGKETEYPLVDMGNIHRE